MDKVLKPERLDVDPSSTYATAEFSHWLKTFTHYLSALEAAGLEHSKLQVLINMVSYKVYQHIANIKNYDQAMQVLQDLYVKPKNIISARHELRMCKQLPGESINQFVLKLEKLSKECDCHDVTAEQYRLELMRDAFIAGMLSVSIQERLLENRNLTFRQAYEQARAQELAHKNSESFKELNCRSVSTSNGPEERFSSEDNVNNHLKASSTKAVCYFCDKSNHPRHLCPAKNVTCNYCNKIGHFFKVCQRRIANGRQSNTNSKLNAMSGAKLAMVSATATQNSDKVLCDVQINGIKASSLMQ